MDLLADLNFLANIAHVSDNLGSVEDAVQRWTALFGYEPEEAEEHITEQRADLGAGLISKALWESVQTSGSADGHDRESYTHLLKILNRKDRKSDSVGSDAVGGEYLVRLGRQNMTSRQIMEAAGLGERPKSFIGVSGAEEHNCASFCIVSSAARQRIINWALQRQLRCPDFIPISIAPKVFDGDSIAPTLGRQAILPQHRMKHIRHPPRPRQDEYPVWYFFYGTLQNPDTLRSALNGSDQDEYDLRPTKVFGGKLVSWGGKYKALVDDSSSVTPYAGAMANAVEGSAYLVQSECREDSLRIYETKAYEVVRCLIEFADGSEILGCTFRFRNAESLV
ncbi:unnamed protein product [Zymoseptoria tritici ST99CH_1A5]|uniref:Uncharacterized protein n=3 Tax=Zymoseptoria tritici TaxID=1047171 RepID=A0A2H1G3H1_ZYMTR|nr:unnamed protein product [Zymoseptoria tritici ST99CH_1E4]SMR49331.1 unnamed protein product [Zymoseptoria tritici ST99CH_3D1]SMY22031.1 unnamed protein product [Zymoseptoria tritici ST99CH_1A5]